MTTYQQILIMQTAGETLRSEAVGWTCEDSSLWRPGPIGKTPGVRFPYTFATPLEAMGRGWTLMAPPREWTQPADEEQGRAGQMFHEWWFTKTVKP